MINTPCVQCIYLIGDRGSYHCRSQETSLDDDIALGWVGGKLPDCPFFSERQPVDKIPLGSDSLVVVKPTRRRRRKRSYTQPSRTNSNVDLTYLEIIEIIEKFIEEKRKSPSAPQIHKRSRFLSKGYVSSVVSKMVRMGILERNTDTTTRRYKYGYKVVKFP